MTVAVIMLLVVAAVAAHTDARWHRIPNALSFLAAVCAAAVWWDAGAPLGALTLAAAAAWCLYVLWDAELFGGGDVKLVPPLILAVASTGDPVVAGVRVGVFALVLLGVAILWCAAAGTRSGPLAVGAPLALAVALAA